MTAFDKEKIFVELRKYHLEEFPKSFSTPRMTALFEEYKNIEDDLVSMIFGLVNGKTEFVDFSDKLKAFNAHVKATQKDSEPNEKADQEIFLEKSNQLSQVLAISASGDFKLRPQRKPRIVRSTNPREIIEN